MDGCRPDLIGFNVLFFSSVKATRLGKNNIFKWRSMTYVIAWKCLIGIVGVNIGDPFIITANQDLPRVFGKIVGKQFGTPSIMHYFYAKQNLYFEIFIQTCINF